MSVYQRVDRVVCIFLVVLHQFSHHFEAFFQQSDAINAGPVHLWGGWKDLQRSQRGSGFVRDISETKCGFDPLKLLGLKVENKL